MNREKRLWRLQIANHFGRRPEIVLPAHLFDRIRASAAEHDGIGVGLLFNEQGFPVCVHGHAWGTQARYRQHLRAGYWDQNEPELRPFLSFAANDHGLIWMAHTRPGETVSFRTWQIIFNVKRGEQPVKEQPADDLLLKRLQKSIEETMTRNLVPSDAA